jgi:iron complex outermembrane receptor protein
MQYKIYFIVLLLVVCISSQAQTLFRGKVVDKNTNQPIPGVSIQEQGTKSGTITGADGSFSLSVSSEEAIIKFSFVGYISKMVKVKAAPATVALEESFLELNQVVVSSSREAQARTETPIAISKISSKELQETKAATLDQVMNKVSGVYMVNLGNEQHSMSIRQPFTLKSLFLYLEDGVPIRPTGVYNHNALLEMNMAATSSIEVIKGPASSIYGSEAIGGSINFITQSASIYPTAKLSIQADNLGYKRTDFGAGNTFGKLGVYVGGYYANRRNGYREHNEFDKLALTLRTDYAFTNGDKWTSTASLIDYQADMSGSIDSTMFYSRQYPSLHTFTYRKVKALRLQSTFDHYWNEDSKTAFTAFFRDNLVGQNPAYRVKNNRSNPSKATGEINESTYQSYGFIAQHRQELGFKDAFLIGGISLDYSPTRYAAEFIAVDRNPETGKYSGYTSLDSLLTNYSVGLLNQAAYAQLSLNPVGKLQLVLAARYDNFTYNYKNYLTPNAFSGAPDSKNYFSNISPKVGFTYDFGKTRGVYGNYSIGFVPPQVTELYRGVKVPVLEPSMFNNYEIGGWWSFSNEKGYLETSLYRMEGTNEIISVLLKDGTTENKNAGETLHQGIEYTLKYAPVKSLNFRFSGTNALHEFVSYEERGERFDGKEMNAAPNWIANAEAFYYPAFLKGARIGLEWQHIGAYYMDPANIDLYEGFDVLNLRLAYAWKGFESWLNVMNLGDELYATNASSSGWGKTYSPGDPRTFSVGIGYNFSKKEQNEK